MAASAYATRIERAAHLALRVFAGLVFVYLVAPVFVVVPLSFTSSQLLVFPLPGWSLQWYRDFFTNPLWTGALANSLFVGVIVMLTATTLGTREAAPSTS